MRTIAVTLMLCLPVAAFAQDAADNGHLLVRAAEAGQLDEVRRLMQAGTEVDAVDGAGVTGLMQAAAQDRVAVVQELLKHRPNLDLTEPNRGQTALHIAIARRRGAVVPLLLAAGAHVTATDRSGRTPLELALDTRSFRAARLLIRAGADPATKLHDGQPAICRAVAGRSADLLRLMLDRGVSASLNCPDARDGTLLLSAVSVEHDNEELLTVLLAHGARIDEQGGRDGLSPLLLAAGQYKLHLVRYLIEHGADPNTTAWDGRTLLDMPEDFARAAPVRDYVLERWGDRLPAPVRNAHELLRAVRRGDPAELKRRLDDPAVKLQDPAGRRQYPVGSVAMQEAARLGNLEAIRLLRRHGVPPKLRNRVYPDHDAVGFAAEAGHWEVVRELVEAGALAGDSIPGANFCGFHSLLGAAAVAGRLDVMQLLWQRGARLDTGRDDEPDFPVCVLEKGGVEVTTFLLDHRGANINRRFDAGYGVGKTTLVLAAIQRAPLPVIELLADRGADLRFQTVWNLDGRRIRVGAADVAALANRYDVLAFLVGRKAAGDPKKALEYELLRAAFDGDRKVVERMLPKASATQRARAMSAAALGNRAIIIRDLVAAGVPVDGRSPASDEETALMLAMRGGNIEAVGALLEAGADLRARRTEGSSRTAMGYAATALRKELIAVLKRHGLTASNDLAAQLVTACAEQGNAACLELLSTEGIDVKATAKGYDPLLAAAAERRPATVRFLLEHGARLSGEGHLVAAVGGGKRSDDMVATARLLIEAGASLEETDPYGQTPLHKAVTYGNEPWPAMLELLRRAGADRCHRNLMGQDVTAAAVANHPELLYWIEQPGWTCKTLAESLQIRPQRGLSPERLRTLNAVALPRPQPALIVMEQTALRADPTPAARQTGTLTVGTRGAIVARMTTATEQGGGTGHWLRWDDGGRTGWVFSPSVAFIDHADAALLTGRLAADERVTFELSLAGGTSRCALRVGTRRFAPDQQFGRWEKEEAPVATLLLLAGLSGATSRDPVCVSSISGTVQFCPLLSTPGAPPSFTPAPCVTMDTPPPSEPVTPFAAAYRQRVR